MRATNKLRLHRNTFTASASLVGKAVARRAKNQLRVHNGTDTNLRCVYHLARGVQVQPQLQKQVSRAYSVEGSIALPRSPTRRLLKAKKSPLRAEQWWSLVFWAPLFLRTLLRLVFVCPHRHRGPPITLRDSIPSNLPRCRSVKGRGSYITCLDCGQKFAYNSKTRRLVDFWGIHDAKALAGIRRRIDGFFSAVSTPLRTHTSRS